MKKWLSVLLAVFLLAGVCAGCGETPSGKVEELEELKGRVVYSIGQGNVPDLVFRYLLQKAGVEYRLGDTAQEGVVSLAYVAEGTEFIGGLTAGKMNYGVISEPAATVALGKVNDAQRMFDVQQLYTQLTNTQNGYPQAALVIKKSFLDAHTAYVQSFLTTFKQDVKWAESQPAAALQALKDAGSTSVPQLTADIAKGCNLGFVSAKTCKAQLLDFYNGINGVALEGEQKAVPKLPDDNFFIDVDELLNRDIPAQEDIVGEVNIYAPDGAPAISLSKMIADGSGGADTKYHIVQPTDIGPSVQTGAADIAIMPTNAAAKLYGAGAGIVMLGVTNFGSLYMIGKA